MKTNTLNIKQAFVKGSVAFIIVLIAFAGNSQSLNVKAGVNMSMVNFFDDGVREYQTYVVSGSSENYTESYSSKMKMLYGWNAGMTYEFKAKGNVSFETGLTFMTKGYRNESSYRETYQSQLWTSQETSILKIHYMDIPLTMKFNFINKGIRVYGNAGAYFGIALKGKQIDSYEYISNSEFDSGSDEQILDFSDKYDAYDLRLNAGVTAGMGVEYKNIFIEANYSAGLMNLRDTKYGALLNKDLCLSVGYKFKFNKEK